MNPDTGEIRSFTDDREAAAEGFTVPIPEGKLANVMAMSRRKRREWAREQGLPASEGSMDALKRRGGR